MRFPGRVAGVAVPPLPYHWFMPIPNARIRVAPADAVPEAALRALQVAPEQFGYVGDVTFNMLDAGRDPLSDAMAVLADARVVGFYRLDRAPRTVTGRDLGEPTLGLRGLFIDRRLQGRGFGTAALQACCEDARERYRDRRLLVLAVHCCNHAAIATYLRAGFHDTGERLPGGAAGTQQLMLRRLAPTPDTFAESSPP